MKWTIPAKTFLLGEYVAIGKGPAIVLTTFPCFEITLSEKEELQGIHSESPAGQWWLKQANVNVGLKFHDPYHGRGGVGASSAQFLGAYLADCYVKQKPPTQVELLQAYQKSSWQGIGTPPSGYDVLAQAATQCVLIDKQTSRIESKPWPFDDIAFILMHTGEKLATHHHLESFTLPEITPLVSTVELGITAFKNKSSKQFIEAINTYHQQLMKLNLVAEHSQHQIKILQKYPNILAIKGCGAMGADILLLIVPSVHLYEITNQLLIEGRRVIATTEDIYQIKDINKLFEKKCKEFA